MRRIWAVAVMAAIGSAMPAAAQTDNHNGYREIAAGNLPAAEHVIAQQRRLFPNDADLTLNLAYLYAHTGRAAQARALYGEVLNRPDDILNRADGSAASAHALARAGLAQVTVEMTLR